MKKIKKFHYLLHQKIQVFVTNGSTFYLKKMVKIYYLHHVCNLHFNPCDYLGHIRVKIGLIIRFTN